MADSQASIETITPDRPSSSRQDSGTFVLGDIRNVLVLPTHLTSKELHEVQDQICEAGGAITDDIFSADLVLTAIASPRRTRFELQIRGVDVSSFVNRAADSSPVAHDDTGTGEPDRKRRRVQLHSSSDEAGKQAQTISVPDDSVKDARLSSPTTSRRSNSSKRTWLRVVKLKWFQESVRCGNPPLMSTFIIMEGFCERSPESESPKSVRLSTHNRNKSPQMQEVAENPKGSPRQHVLPANLPGHEGAIGSDGECSMIASLGNSKSPLAGSHDSGSETEGSAPMSTEMPEWVKHKKIYACERSTPPDSPNADFMAQLKRVRLARVLIEDEVGVRAYSTSIASLAAFPRRLSSPREVLALPGCDRKIARLFREYKQSGHIKAAEQIKDDPALSVIADFYEIFGVGARTAREFYYDRGWRSTDDIIEKGWEVLSRSQQVGLKYYDEFARKIPRSEVEYIASVVTYHARQLVDERLECVIVGGYRRGKAESGDVDLILSHRREDVTSHLITPLVHALERAGWITHLLSLSERNSARDQAPIPIRPRDQRGSGFDTLDKALAVWQDPTWGSKETDLAADPEARNPNPHRRVDIIISPWRTVGCAVTGWSSGTTFQRDLRRYAKHAKGWKFDSSGVRDRVTGQWIDLERWTDEKTRAKTWQEAERRVFEGLGLEWKTPEERCTE